MPWKNCLPPRRKIDSGIPAGLPAKKEGPPLASDRKQSFLHGAALLAAATAIVKVIGALYKIPLGNIIGDAGFGYFNTAYDIYSVLLMISTAGLPVAMSRMIAESASLGNYGQIRRTYQTAQYIFLGLGAAGTILMTCFSRQLAGFMNSPNSWAAIAALGPAAILMCQTSAFRGFFQGQGNMRPTSFSEVLEALCKLVVGLGLAYLIMATRKDTALAAGGAILGVTTGSLVATIFMYRAYRIARREQPLTGGPVFSYGSTAKKLLAIAIPITVGSAGLQIITLIDAKVVMSQLIGPAGFTQAEADSLKGIYNFAQTIFNLPCAFIPPITISVLPAITGQLTLRNFRAARNLEESAARVTGLVTMPCAIGLAVMAQPVMALLRGYEGATLVTAGNLLAVLGLCVVFNSVVLLTNAIMQAHGYVYLPVMNMFLGGIIKVIVNYILVSNPEINIQGAPVGTLCCYLSITILNIFAMRKVIHKAPSIPKNLLKPFLAALVMGIVAFGSWKLTAMVTSSRLLQCALPILLAGVVYVLLAVRMQVITYADCMLLKKKKKIAQLLHIRKKQG